MLLRTLISIKNIRPPAMSKEFLSIKSKYNGRCKKRKWEERRSDFKVEVREKRECLEPFERVKRRKYVLLMGYSGSNYNGMQRNPEQRTIEEELFKALLGAKLITEEAFSQVQTIQFQRAARTDKGVSAARQIVSIKLPENLSIGKVNELLPEEIRVFGYKRVTKGFNSKSQCDARTYMYMLPTFAFAKQDESITPDIFRADEALIARVNELLGKYTGTKNFHNFTSKRHPKDPSCNRYMVSFICEKPFVESGVEFAVLKVKGQSFMLHQIRKMVGLVISIIRGYASEETFARAFSADKVTIPKAPGLGLVLEYVHYDRYNYRYGEDGVHEKLVWDELDDVVEAFKKKYIYPTIVDIEINEGSMLLWLAKASTHNYDAPEVEDDEQNEEEEEGENDDEDLNNHKEEGTCNGNRKSDDNVNKGENL